MNLQGPKGVRRWVYRVQVDCASLGDSREKVEVKRSLLAVSAVPAMLSLHHSSQALVLLGQVAPPWVAVAEAVLRMPGSRAWPEPPRSLAGARLPIYEF